jgi:hypothetical protein
VILHNTHKNGFPLLPSTALPGYINELGGYQIIDIGAAFYGARYSVLLLQYSFTGLDIELHTIHAHHPPRFDCSCFTCVLVLVLVLGLLFSCSCLVLVLVFVIVLVHLFAPATTYLLFFGSYPCTRSYSCPWFLFHTFLVLVLVFVLIIVLIFVPASVLVLFLFLFLLLLLLLFSFFFLLLLLSCCAAVLFHVHVQETERLYDIS